MNHPSDLYLAVGGGLLAILIALVGIIYTNLRDRIKSLEDQTETKFADVYRYIRHEARDINGSIAMLTREFLRTTKDDFMDAMNKRRSDE